MLRSVVLPMMVLALAGCGVEAPDSPERGYRLALDSHELMEWVLDPAADVIWGSAGSVVTLEGEQNLAPVDDEGWARVRHAAATVMESGNLLMLPGRSRGDAWDGFAHGMMVVAERAIHASDARDDGDLFEAGAQLYSACVACHDRYMLAEADAH